MHNLGTQRLETERLVLRRFEVADAPAVWRNWASDHEVTRYLTWPAHASAAVTEQVLADWAARYENPAYYQWAIVPKDDPAGEPIGSIGVNNEPNHRTKTAHIGYCLGRPWWGRGVMPEALATVMAFLFDEVGVNRIESRCDARNGGSARVMQKCGMRHEGTLKQADWNNQGICDAECYALVACDRADAPAPCGQTPAR